MDEKEVNTEASQRRMMATSVISVTVLPVTMMSRAYFSSYHLWAAEHFAHVASEQEKLEGAIPRFDIKQRANVTNSIFSAVAAMEAAINEFFQDVADEHEGYIGSIDKDARKLLQSLWSLTEENNKSPFSVLEKAQLALTLCRKPTMSKGTALHDNANLAIKIRNELTHFKPKTLGGTIEHPLTKHFKNKGKFKDNPLMKGNTGNPYFPDHCLASPCALWALSASRAFMDEFYARLDIEPNYQKVSFDPPATATGQGAQQP
jgi:hypothetical protein